GCMCLRSRFIASTFRMRQMRLMLLESRGFSAELVLATFQLCSITQRAQSAYGILEPESLRTMQSLFSLLWALPLSAEPGPAAFVGLAASQASLIVVKLSSERRPGESPMLFV